MSLLKKDAVSKNKNKKIHCIEIQNIILRELNFADSCHCFFVNEKCFILLPFYAKNLMLFPVVYFYNLLFKIFIPSLLGR